MCNNCGNNNCVKCNTEPQLCGCPIKLPFECTNYTGIALEPLGIEEGMDGNMIIKIINDYIKEVVDNLEIDPTVLENIGGKVEIYKGLSSTFKHEIKTIEGTEGVIVENLNTSSSECENGSEDYINIRIDTEWLGSFICQTVQECLPQQPTHIITTSDIVINLSNGASYTFSAQDFLNHFTDSYANHQLSEVRLTGNVVNLSYQGNPYVSGTWIPISNVTQLVYNAPNQTGTHTEIIPWDGKDNVGNIST